ncbi:hypothetical protein [Pseudactinotalea sp. HY158]|uniref:hypothetical protein n=1 Tax=Pseudactinotalea sp. HY158 TaxID=2654547 RepID=UPI00129CFFDF|nr:hypothetical protein [Pseudactinotalea sp. HY158]QGH68914.1 hypothetical protein GCE65_04905 [Pseudactinotalea sp. HY158]
MTSVTNDQGSAMPQEPKKQAGRSPAVWFFVAAVFVVVLPTLPDRLNFPLNPIAAWVAGAVLTLIGFWVLLRRR